MSETRQSTAPLTIDPDLDVPSGLEAEVLATATAAAVLPPSTHPRPVPQSLALARGTSGSIPPTSREKEM
jgi:hypothetical protein